MINVVIPMAGRGSRFSQSQYTKPKPFIEFQGLTMIEHVVRNLKMPNARYIAIARREHVENEAATIKRLQSIYEVEFITIDQVTEGPACTVLFAHRLINTGNPLLIANSDQIVDIPIGSYVSDCLGKKLDGSILTFKNSDPKWSYARVDEEGLVCEVREKVAISEHATVGIYFFSQGVTFIESAIDMIVRNDRVNNEFYVAPTYNYAIAQGKRIGIFEIAGSKMHGTGTPEDLDNYLKTLTNRGGSQ